MQKNLKLLYRSFEENLLESEKLQLQQALEKSPKLRERKNRIEKLRLEISGTPLPKGKPFLAKRVMHRINSAMEDIVEPFWVLLFNASKKAAFAMSVVLILLVCYHLFFNNNFAGDDEVVIDDLVESDMYFAFE